MNTKTSNIILENIRKRAKKIFSKNERLVEKVNADNELKLTRIQSHITLILKMMKEEGIIDTYTASNPMDLFGVDGSVICFSLRKKGGSNVVHIFTDGLHVVLRDGGFLIDFGEIGNDCVRCANFDDIDAYDWVRFTDLLLDFISKVLYNDIKVNELAIFGINK